jgi:hypothetical protein
VFVPVLNHCVCHEAAIIIRNACILVLEPRDLLRNLEIPRARKLGLELDDLSGDIEQVAISRNGHDSYLSNSYAGRRNHAESLNFLIVTQLHGTTSKFAQLRLRNSR